MAVPSDPAAVEVDPDFRENAAVVMDNRIDVNSAGIAELMELPGMHTSDAAAVVAFRRANGPFTSSSEAANIPGISAIASDSIRRYAVASESEKPAWGVSGGFVSAWHSSRLLDEPDVMKLPDFATTIESRTVVGTGNRASGTWRAGLSVIAAPGVWSVKASSAAGHPELVADGPTMTVDPVGFGFSWTNSKITVSFGTYKVGFGTGLTIDVTGLKSPSGHFSAFGTGSVSENGTIGKQTGFSGLAIDFSAAAGSSGLNVSGTVFASYAFRDPYRTEVVRERCFGAEECSESSEVPFIRYEGDEPGTGTSDPIRLRDIVREAVAGAALGIGTARWQIQMIGYAAGLRYRPSVPGIGPAAFSPYPENRLIFGAVGLAGKYVPPDPGIVRAELAVNDRGNPAAVAEFMLSPTKTIDIEGLFRYYHRNWDNPFSGSPADSAEYRGNRTRDELGGYLAVLWKSSGFTTNGFRLDGAGHGPDGLAGSHSRIDLAASTSIEIRPSGRDRISIEAEYRDRDLGKSGRGLSWEPYGSGSAGNLSGGCLVSWNAGYWTDRVPRTKAAFWVMQAFRDSAALENAFEIDMAATVRFDIDAHPGPGIGLFARWSDESLTADPTPAAGARCASDTPGGTSSGMRSSLPGICRGDTAIRTGIDIDRAFPIPGGRVMFAISARYTRHLDDRSSWSTREREDARDEYGFTVRIGFARESGRRTAAGRDAD